MDVTIGMGNAGATFISIYNALMIPFQIGFFALMLVACGAFLYYLYVKKIHPRKWNIDFRVLDKLNNTALAHDDFARAVSDDQGLIWWHLQKAKCKIPPAPHDAILPTNTGRKCVIAEKMEAGQYRYLKYNTECGFFDVLTSNQKSVIVDQVVKAELKRKNNWKQNLPQIVAVGGVVIMFTVAVIFAPSIIEKGGAVVDKMDNIATKQIEMLDRLDKGERGIQIAKPNDFPKGG